MRFWRKIGESEQAMLERSDYIFEIARAPHGTRTPVFAGRGQGSDIIWLCSPCSLQHVLDRAFGKREFLCVTSAQHHIRVGAVPRTEARSRRRFRSALSASTIALSSSPTTRTSLRSMPNAVRPRYSRCSGPWCFQTGSCPDHQNNSRDNLIGSA